MSAALGAATATSCARPHRAASGASAGPSRGPHPPSARHVRWSHGPNAISGAMRRLLPMLPSSRTAMTRASLTDDAPSSRGTSAAIPGDAITRREALARTEASLARNDDWRDVLATVTHAAQLSGLPPARCVRGPRLWGHAGARWDLPAVLAMLRSLDGADFACCVRLVGEKGGARDALEVYKEGVKAGYDAGDGGASRAAMAWVHDARGQGKHADALWTELHAEAEAGRVDPGECARVAAGLNTWWKNNKSRGTKQQRRRRAPASASEDATNDASSSSKKNHSDTQTMEVYALEIASKSRKRPRAAAEAYARLSEWHRERWKTQGRRSRITDVRVYTAACRAASALRDPRFARSVAVDVIAASPRCVIDDYMVASLAPVIGRDGSTRSADVVEALFDSARRSNGRSNVKLTDVTDDDASDDDGDTTRRLGGAAWSCVIGALCRAGATGRASELLDEMANEPFMRRWPSCPTPGDAASTSTRSSIFDMSVDEDGDDKDGDEAAAAWAADAKHARSAAAQRRAAAPAYAQLMHVLLNSSARRGAQRALDVHKKMAAHGIAAPENPRHYRALYKAMLRGGGLGGRRMSPMQAAAASVADAVVASENLVGDVDVKARAAAAARASLHVAAVAGLPDVASRTLENLRGAGVAPVPEDLELTLEAFERAGDAAGAVELWEANRAALDQLNGSSSARGYNNDEREHMYDAMRVGLGGLGCEPTRRAWTAIVKAYCEAGEPIGAQRLLEESVESTRRKIGQDRRRHKGGHKGSSATRGASRRFISRERNGQRNGRHDGVELIAFNLVSAAFGRLGDPRRAERVLRGMLDDPHGDGVVPMPDRVTYNTVIDAYATNARPKRVGGGDVSVAQPSRSQLNADSNSVDNPDSDSPEFDPSSEEDPCDAAFRLLREMRSPKVRVEPCLKTWTSVLSACARSGDPHRAAEAFDRMRASGIAPDTKAWTALMQSHVSRGDLGATAEVYWRMRTEGVAPNEGTLGAALAAGRVGGGDVSKLIAIYRDMRALDVRPNNRGFRQLTEMWVDQAFDDVDEHGGGAGSDGDGVTHARVHPNFMLADVLGPNVDGPAESIASRAVARSGDASGNGLDDSGNLIDVHGLSVPETRAAVLSVLQALLERRRSGLGVHGNLVIVTGVGRSTPSEPPLRDAVVKLAGDLKLEVDIAPTNPGRLVAKEATLLTWLDRDRNETWSKERELVASVPIRKIRTGNRTDGGKGRGGTGGQRRYVGRRGRGAPRPTPTTGGLDSALRQWLDENSDESDSTTD